MERVTVAKIEESNPIARIYYKKAIQEDKKIEENIGVLPFYAIYLDSVYRAASVVIKLSREERKAVIKMINFSDTTDKERLEQEATKELTTLISENYGVEEIELFSPVKVLSK